MLSRIEKEHIEEPKSLLIQDGRQNIVWDLETNCRNNFFPGESEQISGTFYMGDFDSVSPQLFRVPRAVVWEVTQVTLLAEPQSKALW